MCKAPATQNEVNKTKLRHPGHHIQVGLAVCPAITLQGGQWDTKADT